MVFRLLWMLLLAAVLGGCGASYETADHGQYRPPAVESVATSHASGDVAEVEAQAAPGPGGLFQKSTSEDKRPEPSGGGQPNIDRKFVKNAWLDVEVRDEDDFEPSVEKVELIARKLDGYTSKQSQSSITIKVPTGRLDEALAAIAEIGEVVDRDIDVLDVTRNYVDLQIRIENLKQLRTRLQELVEEAENVEAVLAVEKELARVTRELESLEGQMRVLKNQTSYATVSVQFQERVLPGPVGWIFYGAYHAIKWLFVWD